MVLTSFSDYIFLLIIMMSVCSILQNYEIEYVNMHVFAKGI